MSNIVNLDRDMSWGSPVAPVSSQTGVLGALTIGVGNDGSVGQRHSVAFCTPFVRPATNVSEISSFGCLILPPPDGDAVPYRLRGSLFSAGYGISWSVGYFDGGTACSVNRLISSGPSLDDVFVIRPVAVGDPSYGKPLMFYGSVHRDVSALNAGYLSVQRLLSKPDQYASAVS